MAINKERSYTEYNVEVPTTDFPIGFDILDDGLDVVAVTLNDVDPTTLGYTVIQVNNTTYRFAPAVPSGVVRLTRITDIDQMAHVFTEGAIFISENMDGNFKQIRHSQQEVRDRFGKLALEVDAAVVVSNNAAELALEASILANSASGLATQASNDVIDTNTIVQTSGEVNVTLTDGSVVPNMNKRIADYGNKVLSVNGEVGVVSITDTDIPSGSYQKQSDINMYGGRKYDMPVGGYPLNAKVLLENGDIVKSTEPNNTNDPNSDMTGWENQEKNFKNKLDFYTTPELFGAPANGEDDDTPAFLNALQSKNKIQLDGDKTYCLSGTAASAAFANMRGKWIYGNGATIRIKGGDFGIKSPVASGIFDVKFVGDGDKRQRIWVSNYTVWYFMRCSFRNFCYAELQDDTTAVFMYAGKAESTLVAAGDSKHGRLIDCDFDGERKTMFGVRIYTEFQTVNQSEYTNTDTQVIRGNFDQYMWNGVEIAGPKTIACGVVGATAYNSGLGPFDLDKGCQNCFIRNVHIDKITGLPATVWASNTRPSVVNISGTAPFGLFSKGNIVEGVTAKLYKADLDALSAYGAAIITISTSNGDTVKNINVSLDGLPVSAAGGKMGLAMLVLSDVGGCSVGNIKSSHATHGIIEDGVTLASGSTKANEIKNIRCDNALTGEIIGLAKNYEHARVYHIKDLRLSTTMTTAKFTEATAINHKAQHANAYLDMSNVRITSANNNAINAQGSKLGLRSVYFAMTGRTSANLFNSANSLTWLNLNDVRVNTSPMLVDLALANLAGNYVVSTQSLASEFDRFESVNGGDLWTQSASPANPPVANYPTAQRLRKQSFTTTGGYEFVAFGAAWRSVGVLI